MEFGQWLCAWLGGGMCWVAVYNMFLLRFFTVYRKHEYRWECPEIGCDFVVTANQQEIVLYTADDHERNSTHGEE